MISTTISYPRIAMHACQDIVLCARSDPPAAFDMSRIRHWSGAGFPECSIGKRNRKPVSSGYSLSPPSLTYLQRSNMPKIMDCV